MAVEGLDTTGHVGLDARGAGHGQEALVVEVELVFPEMVFDCRR